MEGGRMEEGFEGDEEKVGDELEELPTEESELEGEHLRTVHEGCPSFGRLCPLSNMFLSSRARSSFYRLRRE